MNYNMKKKESDRKRKKKLIEIDRETYDAMRIRKIYKSENMKVKENERRRDSPT